MRTPVPDYLEEVLDQCSDNSEGALADYISKLAEADPDRHAVALCLPDGTRYSAGDDEFAFSIQSISKPFVYALALEDHGVEWVEERVGVEPSGDPFNEISLQSSGRPHNPMVNIGAVTTHALVGDEGLDPDERFALIRAGLGAFAGRELDVDEEVFEAEFDEADHNLALAHMVRSIGIFTAEPHDVVREYSRQCSLSVTVRDLAVMALTLALGGHNPVTGEQVVSRRTTRQVLSVMATCGMYNAAGDWMTDVGMPAKSGVSGGIIGALPGQTGVAAFSPKLDEFGNSVRGVQVFERLSADMGLHMMDAPTSAADALRASDDIELSRGQAHRLTLQGPMHFVTAERMLRQLEDVPGDAELVVLDIGRVTSVNDVGRRMLLEGLRRVGLDGHPVLLVDPASVLPDPEQDEVDLTVVQELDRDE